MSGIQNFRSAFNGFNRQDVVQYIEFINHQHNSQLEQLTTQLQNAREELSLCKNASQDDLQAQLDAALARCAALEEQLATCQNMQQDNELEAYRRAERAERKAKERADQIYAQANAVLADATVKVEAAATQMNDMAQQIQEKLLSSKAAIAEAVDAMYAIRPEEE
jgi:hypothetical protein